MGNPTFNPRMTNSHMEVVVRKVQGRVNGTTKIRLYRNEIVQETTQFERNCYKFP